MCLGMMYIRVEAQVPDKASSSAQGFVEFANIT